MKIAVLIKSVLDTSSVLKVSDDRMSILAGDQSCIMNPYDEYALEEAVRIKESHGAEVIAVSVGDKNTERIIRNALAVGADSAFFVQSPPDSFLNNRGISKILAAIVKLISPEIIFAGKQAVDDESAQVAERVAEILRICHVSAVNRFELFEQRIFVDRQIEGGYYRMELACPALLTVDKGINTPRYPTLPNILKAKKKEINEIPLADLKLGAEDLNAGIKIHAFVQPKQKRLKRIVEGPIAHQVKWLAIELSKMI